ncbi:MAG: peptide chain release factor N(5)-glutamine methyltransferase [Rhodobacteraceae bacterium]|nr:peptide chain release factor N(5)-glutamine methyltransferase [Paracoccaceae bacterium]
MTGTPTAAQVLAQGVRQLGEAGIPDPARDGRRLMAHVLGIPATRLTLALAEPVTTEAAAAFQQAIAERARCRPVAQIVGWRRFWGREFIVSGDVLDPRPETETLIAAALTQPAGRVLDLGTGTGCILLSLLAEWPEATGLGTDISAAALEVARRNAEVLALGDRAKFAESDWAAAVQGRFDLIVSNPPYISEAEMARLDPDVREWEPECALTPGGDGLDAYRTFLPQLAGLLQPDGRVLVEIGAAQGAAVAALGRRAGFEQVEILGDLDGRDRVVVFSSPGD